MTKVRISTEIRSTFDTLADAAMLDDSQVAAVLGIGVSTLRRWRREGRGPGALSLNGMPRTPASTVRQFLSCLEPAPRRGSPSATNLVQTSRRLAGGHDERS